MLSFPSLSCFAYIAFDCYHSPNPKVSDQLTSKLPVPSSDDPNRSTSPSPTQDMIKGAGTTPILPLPPDPGFGEDSGIDESNISRSNSPLPASISAPPPSGESSPFGQPSEPSPFAVTFGDDSDNVKSAPPARPPPPPQSPIHPTQSAPPSRPPPPSSMVNVNDNIFGNDTEFGDQSAPPRPPMPPFANIPFASLDPIQQQYIIQQQILLQQQLQQKAMSSPQLPQKQQKKASAFEDLDLAMRSTMAKPPKPVGSQQPTPDQTQATPLSAGMVYIPPGTVPPAGYIIIPGMPSYGIPAGVVGQSLATEGFLIIIRFVYFLSLYLFLALI